MLLGVVAVRFFRVVITVWADEVVPDGPFYRARVPLASRAHSAAESCAAAIRGQLNLL